MFYAKKLNALCEGIKCFYKGIKCFMRRNLKRENAMLDDMRLNV